MHDLSVVHLLAPAPYGGLESVVERLTVGQRAAGLRVTVVCVTEEASHPFVARLRERNLTVEHIVVGARRYLTEGRRVCAVLRGSQPHVVHTHGYRSDVLGGGVARRLGIPTVTTVHGYTGGGLKDRIYEWIQTRSFRRFAAVVAVSSKLGQELLAGGVPRERVHVVHNGFGESTAAMSRAAARVALELPERVPAIGWIGRLSFEKAPDLAITALSLVEEGDAMLSILGTGPLESKCRDLIRDLGLADRVRLHGFVRDASRHLKAFDLVVISSRTEGTPMLLLEAVEAEVPLVATSVGGVPELLGPEEALLCAPDDAQALARSIDRTLTEPALSSQRATAASRRLERDLSLPTWVARYSEVYRSVLDFE